MACRITKIRRPTAARVSMRPGAGLRTAGLLGLLVGHGLMADAAPPASRSAEPAAATHVSPAAVSDFTRRVQPLVLNRCAAGACHGGPEGPEPRFIRPDSRGGIDRRSTVANMHAFLAVIGPERDAGRLAALLAVGHPAKPASPRLAAAALSTQERLTLDRWLDGVRLGEPRPAFDPAVQPAGATTPAVPNRFRDLLESAANPPQFPPPPDPRGVIFPLDRPPSE